MKSKITHVGHWHISHRPGWRWFCHLLTVCQRQGLPLQLKWWSTRIQRDFGVPHFRHTPFKIIGGPRVVFFSGCLRDLLLDCFTFSMGNTIESCRWSLQSSYSTAIFPARFSMSRQISAGTPHARQIPADSWPDEDVGMSQNPDELSRFGGIDIPWISDSQDT